MPSQTLLFRLSKELPCSPPLPDPVPGHGLEGRAGGEAMLSRNLRVFHHARVARAVPGEAAQGRPGGEAMGRLSLERLLRASCALRAIAAMLLSPPLEAML